MYDAKYGSRFDLLPMDILLLQYGYSRQVTKIWAEKCRQGPARWQEIIHLVNSGDPWAKKSRNLQIYRKLHSLGDTCPGGRQRKVGKAGNLLHRNVTCCSLCSHYKNISLEDKTYASWTYAVSLWTKLNKDKNPSLPWEAGAGMKIKEYNPQTPPSPVNILPLHLYALHNQEIVEDRSLVCYSPRGLKEFQTRLNNSNITSLPKKPRAALLTGLPVFPSESVVCC